MAISLRFIAIFSLCLAVPAVLAQDDEYFEELVGDEAFGQQVTAQDREIAHETEKPAEAHPPAHAQHPHPPHGKDHPHPPHGKDHPHPPAEGHGHECEAVNPFHSEQELYHCCRKRLRCYGGKKGAEKCQKECQKKGSKDKNKL